MTEERKKELARSFFETSTEDVDGDVWELINTVAAEAEEGIGEALELAKEKGFSWCQSFGKQINIRNVHEYSEAFDKEMDTIAERLKEKGK